VFNFTGWAKDDRYKEYLGYFKDNILKYGIDANGNWFNIDNGAEYNQKTDRPATCTGIEKALVKEANKRGYEFDFYHLINNVLWVGKEEKGSWVVFNNGTWAEVKKEPKYVLVSEGCYVVKVKVCDGIVSWKDTSNKEDANIFRIKEKAEAMNILLENKYKLEEL